MHSLVSVSRIFSLPCLSEAVQGVLSSTLRNFTFGMICDRSGELYLPFDSCLSHCRHNAQELKCNLDGLGALTLVRNIVRALCSCSGSR